MYSMSAEYLAAAEEKARQIVVKANFNGSTTLTGTNIIDMTVKEALAASDGLSMGTTISSKLVMNIKMPDTPIALSGGYVEPSVSFHGVEEYCPLGKFYITDAKSSNDFGMFSIEAYDGFCKTEIKYSPTIAMPNTAEAIMEDIAAQCGFTIEAGTTYPVGSFDLFDFTCRQYIGYFAGLVGKNARFNRSGELCFVWYADSEYSITRDMQYMGGFKRLTQQDFQVNSITSGTSDQMYTAGNGTGMSFENPFMTQDIIDSIFASVGTFSYTPASVKWRGNPMIEAGDIVVVDDKDGNSRKIYVMEQTLKISGGLNSEIKCYGKSEASIAFDTSPQAKKLQQVYTKLQEAIAEATALLNGANGGVFEITDENGDGVNDGWIIHSADGRKFIKANLGGIGITQDGGATYQQAMTPSGINASVVNTGQMNAQRISVGDAALGDVFSVDQDENGHPVITIGSSANDIKQKQRNDAIEFVDGSGNSVAKFATTGAEWADMQQMKYCGFVWIKSSINGNVRFTKAGN